MKNTNSFISREDAKNKVYYVTDSSILPFKVVVNSEGIEVFKESSEKEYDDSLFKRKRYKGYWSGFDPLSKKSNGNSILIQIMKTKYVFVGIHVFEFTTDEEITDFISYKSAYPTVIAYSKNYVYFPMECHSMIPLTAFKLEPTVENAMVMYKQRHSLPDNLSERMKKVKMIQYRLD